jgi:hypothetical protein
MILREVQAMEAGSINIRKAQTLRLAGALTQREVLRLTASE